MYKNNETMIVSENKQQTLDLLTVNNFSVCTGT